MKQFLISIYQKRWLDLKCVLWISLGLNFGLSLLLMIALSLGLNPLNVQPIHQEFHKLFNTLKGWNFALFMLYLISFLIIFSGLISALIYEIRRRSRLESSLQKAELISLKSQIQPHFLFNTLNMIKALIRENPTKADLTVQRFSELYRYILKASHTELTSFKEELKYSEQYLSIEKIRFGDQLHYSIEVDEKWHDTKIPSLILQPIIENGIRHGISKSVEPGLIRIYIKQKNSKTFLCISDNGI
ncbi:histidine kinase, partial [bacterium]|nr:histidine kinase [bacterium]